jgi:HK97 family phage portal protein
VQDGPGPAVTDSTAMQVGTVYSCLSKLSGAVSQLPVHEYTQRGDDRQRVTPPSPLWWALNESPDPAWTASAWKQWIVRCIKLRGDQHTEILRNLRGEAAGFKVHHPDYVQPRRVGGRLRYDCCDFDTGRVYGVDQDDMLHFTGFGFDGLRSMSAIKWAARNAISGELAASRYMVRSIGEGAMPRIALQMPGGMRPDQQEDLRQSFQRIYGTNGNKLPLVLANGATAKELSISPVDMELIASRKLDKQTICEVMGVPPIIIGDSDKTSSWGTGVEQVTLGWVKFDIQPMLAGWEEELNRKLYRRAGRFLEFSLSALLRGDSKAQAEAFRAAIGGPGTGDGWLTVNEVRKLLNLPPSTDPAHDVPFMAQRNTAQKGAL